MNYFSPKSVAVRYAQGRPCFHPTVIGHVKKFFSITEPLSSALDVGCGTGLSTVALKEIARVVTGADISTEMVALAPKESGVSYLVASAQSLPFAERAFDLVAVSQALHWLDTNRFLTEAHRVLRPDGWLIAYDNYFGGQMTESPEFHDRYKTYLATYPAPRRAKVVITAESASPYGFRWLAEEWHENTARFSLEGLVNYLVTQSNVIAAVEGGGEHIEDVRTRLGGIVGPAFKDTEMGEFLFHTPIWYLQRDA